MLKRRRSFPVSVISLVILLLTLLPEGMAQEKSTEPSPSRNEQFYDTNGKFRDEAAKQAYLDFLQRQGYQLSQNLRENMWVSDFGLGNFVEIGMAGMFWINDQKNNYTALEMILLPGQMIPQHKHVKTDIAAPKMESWHIRYGCTHTYGEGEPTTPMAVTIPESQVPYVTVRRETTLRVGEVAGITKPLELHWQKACASGAIMTEYSTFHDGNAVKFTDPHIKF
jgi:D-lyxose ketol-isomerase